MTPTGNTLESTIGPATTTAGASSVGGPVRTCIGCRVSDAQARLLRFGRRSDGQVQPALVTRGISCIRGRSAYTCPRRACLDQAIKRRAFARAFSTSRRQVSVINVDGQALWAATAEQIHCEIDLLARTSGQDPHAHLRLRGLEQLLFELSSPPSTRETVTSASVEFARKGGVSSHE